MATNPADIIVNPNVIGGFSLPSMGGPDIFGMDQTPVGQGIPDFSGTFGRSGGAPGGGLFAGMTGFDKLNMGLQGLSTIGGLISSFGALSLAKKQFRLQKDVLNTNLNNQIKAYNTALDDKARSRAVVEGQSDTERDAYIAANKATRG